MNRTLAGIAAIVGFSVCGAAAAGPADNPWGLYNPLGFYIGAGGGWSYLGSNGYGYDNYYNYSDNATAWKGMIGIRPIPPVGLELDYIDFGNPNSNGNYYYGNYLYNGNNVDASATSLFAVGYLPLPFPIIDVFAKAGVSRLQQTESEYYVTCGAAGCPTSATPTGYYRNKYWSTDFAYGAGIQGRIPGLGLGLRVEYERITSDNQQPNAVTVSGTWTF
jgi:hypothetical protein